MEHFKAFSLNIRGRLTEYHRPAVMGVVNVTPDSFFQPSRANSQPELAELVEKMIEQGVDIIDVGACSTRPGSTPVDESEELRRLEWALPVIREISTEIPVSVDTFRSRVAQYAVRALGAEIINDVSGCTLDPLMARTVADLQVPYVLTHLRGTPATMDSLASYNHVAAEVAAELSVTFEQLRSLGVNDIIIDPGLGLAKTPAQCYQLLRNIPALVEMFGCPVLVGASRKRMLADCPDASAATTAVNMAAMMMGAAIVRVHDVEAARSAVTVYKNLMN